MKIFDKVFEYLDNKKNIKLLRSFGLVLSCISVAIIFDTFKKYELNLNNFKLNVLLISFFLMMTSYVFFGFAWSKYINKNLGLEKRRSLIYWAYSNLGKYVPGLVGIPLLRISQDDKVKSKNLFFGVIEEQITPILILIPTSLILLNTKLLDNMIISFCLVVSFCIFLVGFIYKKANLFSGINSYVYSRIELLLGFIFQFGSIYFFCFESGLNDAATIAIQYTLASAISLLIIGSPAGIGIREILLLQLTTNYISNELILLLMVGVRTIYFVADVVTGIFGFVGAFISDKYY